MIRYIVRKIVEKEMYSDHLELVLSVIRSGNGNLTIRTEVIGITATVRGRYATPVLVIRIVALLVVRKLRMVPALNLK